MEQNHISDLCTLERKRFASLTEISTLTKDMADALSRSDQLSLQLLLSMRQTPISRLEELTQQVESLLLTLPEEDAIRSNSLLHGATCVTEQEEPLCQQVSANQRLFAAIVELDQQVSLRTGGRKSFYTRQSN